MKINIFDNLEIKRYKSQILSTIQSSKYTLISGPTGCGKSTYIPYILNHYKTIIIEPRRIAVQNLYNTMKDYIDVGYRMRFSHKNINAKCLIMTDGYFINQFINKKVDCEILIMDEIHERSVRCDFIMGMIIHMYFFDAKVVFMSATINYKVINKYFGNVGIVKIKTKGYKQDIFYEDEPCSDYVFESYVKVKHILNLENEKRKMAREIDDIFGSHDKLDEHRDVLIFMPGEDDINDLYKLVRKLPQVRPYKIFSSLDDNEQSKIFEKSELMKVIISTNICETSLTIPGIRYVIDSGLMKEKYYNGINYFGIRAIGKDNANQRAGRCNRMCDGICYRLYTRETYDKMQYSVPEIVKADLTFVVLAMLALKIDIISFNFMTFPNKENVKCALKFLYNIHAIRIDSSIEITNYGKKVLENPFDVHLSHFFQICKKRRIEHVGAIIIAMVSQDNYNFIDRNKKAYRSDLEALSTTFIEYYNSTDRREFCKIRGMSSKPLERALFLYKKITKQIPVCDEHQLIDLEWAFCEAFKSNVAVRCEDGSYNMIGRDIQIFIHPSSQLFKTHAKKIVFLDVFATSKNYARIINKYTD